jgi:C-terminal, D2-small domain, of ClpB protein
VSALTAGADLAWKLGASEAAAARHAQIDNTLLLVGILGLQELGGAPAELALTPEVRRGVEDEARRLGDVLAACGLEPGALRQRLRERAGLGSHVHDAEAVSRSAACKETFFRAAMLSGPGGVTALDLLAALGESPNALVTGVLREAGASVERLREEARRASREGRAAHAAGRRPADPQAPATPTLEDAIRLVRLRLRRIIDEVESRHGITLVVEPEAEAFVARTGTGAAGDARELGRAVERLVEAPLGNLIQDGKIRKHPAWRVAYDEGGIYVVPGT